ncbi:glycerophosphoryl diester phosphodiesterase membrane domain-containing protein [Isoalcanivorax indicus]|uniref:glycerophosphoryl diester phosphodiesterase membrane domain-containing protein n=1 Tax=Isoalcanivorax indicus TaxID=2202653 RepID=UPI000DBA3495|nr:glycerophosphoryl diester phosphodiesterase membrane domain-containing protein [Isoalcanivorax indicus]
MIGQRIQETLRFWWRNIPALLLVTLPFALASELVQGTLGAALQADEEGIRVNELSALLILLLRPFAEGAIMAQMAAIHMGQTRSLAESLMFSLRAAPVLLVTYLILGIGVYAGLLLFIFPGAWLYARLCQAPYIAVLEQQTPLRALRTSFERTRADQWQILGAVALVFMLVIVLFQISGILFTGLFGDHAMGSVGLAVVTSLISCLLNIIVFRYFCLMTPGGS